MRVCIARRQICIQLKRRSPQSFCSLPFAMVAAPVRTRGVKSPAKDLVRQMRTYGCCDKEARLQLKAKGFSKSRISQLLRAVPYQGKPVEEQAPAKKRGPPPIRNLPMRMKNTAYDFEQIWKRDCKARVKLARQLAAASRHNVQIVYSFLDALVQQIAENLHSHGEFLFHGMAKFRSKAKAARLESVKNICGRNVTLPALPAHNVPQCSVTRGFSKTLRLLRETA